MPACSLSFLFIYFSFIFISWRLTTLQYCSGFCHTLTWISHGFTCVPHPNPPSRLPLHPIPLGLPSAPGPSTCLMHPIWVSSLKWWVAMSSWQVVRIKSASLGSSYGIDSKFLVTLFSVDPTTLFSLTPLSGPWLEAESVSPWRGEQIVHSNQGVTCHCELRAYASEPRCRLSCGSGCCWLTETRLCLFSSVLSFSSPLTLHLIWEVGTGQRASSSLESMIALLTPWTNINRSRLSCRMSPVLLAILELGKIFPNSPTDQSLRCLTERGHSL